MSRYIDADKIPYTISEDGCLDDFAYRYDINEVPTADVVPVVRCKDCKYSELRYGSKKKGEPSTAHYVCTTRNSTTVGEGYCHWGERREK